MFERVGSFVLHNRCFDFAWDLDAHDQAEASQTIPNNNRCFLRPLFSVASPIHQCNPSWHEGKDLRKRIGYDRCNVLALTYVTAVPPYVNFL